MFPAPTTTTERHRSGQAFQPLSTSEHLLRTNRPGGNEFLAGQAPARNPASAHANAAILVVDDDRDFCARLVSYLASFDYAVCVVHSGPLGLERALAKPWRAIVLSAKPASFDGWDLLRRIRLASDVPLLLVGSAVGESEEIAALEAGADFYLAKSGSSRQLLAHLHAITRRAEIIGAASTEGAIPAEIVVGDLRIVPESRKASLAGRDLVLTHSEFALLLSLARARGKVRTRDHLYAEICAREYEAFDRALDMRVSGLRRKLGDQPKRPRFIRTVRSAGYMLVNPEAA